MVPRCSLVSKFELITIKGDKSALSPGGIRVGLCAITTRGLTIEGCNHIVEFVDKAIEIGRNINVTKLIDYKVEVNKMIGTKNSELNILKNDIIHFSNNYLSKI